MSVFSKLRMRLIPSYISEYVFSKLRMRLIQSCISHQNESKIKKPYNHRIRMSVFSNLRMGLITSYVSECQYFQKLRISVFSKAQNETNSKL